MPKSSCQEISWRESSVFSYHSKSTIQFRRKDRERSCGSSSSSQVAVAKKACKPPEQGCSRSKVPLLGLITGAEKLQVGVPSQRPVFGSVALAQGCLGSSPRGQVGLGFQSPRFSGSLVFSLPPRLSGSLRLTAPGCTLIPLGS